MRARICILPGRRRRLWRVLAGALLLAVMTPGAWAQSPGSESAVAQSPGGPGTAAPGSPASVAMSLEDYARPRRMIFFYEADADSLDPFDSFLLYNSILTSVAAANNSVVFVESPDRTVPFTREGREDLARLVDADAWLHVYAAGGLDDLSVQASLYDMVSREDVNELAIRPGFPVTQRTLARGFWDEIAEAIDAGFEPTVEAADLLIVGLPGTLIRNLVVGDVQLGEDGTARLVLPTPATYTITAELAGRVPVTESFYLGADPLVVTLVQQTAPSYAAEAFVGGFQFPGVGFRYHIVPGSWFARATLLTQYVGVNFVPNRPLFLEPGESKLSVLYLDGGTLLGDLEDPIRYPVSGGVLVRFRHDPFGFERDVAALGIHGAVGVEAAPWRREPVLRSLRLYAEYRPTILFTGSPDEFFDRSFTWNAFPGGRAPGMFPLSLFRDGGGVVFDLRDAHIGVRVTW